MTYTISTNYDSRIPSWPGNGTPFTLFACHDTEGGQGRVGAMGTVQFLIDRRDRGASYHELWWYHENTDEFGVIRIVQPFRAAGSIAPNTPPYYPTSFVKTALGRSAWDPNQGVYAVSIAGRVADVNRYAQNPKFLAHANRRMQELRAELGIDKRAEHFQFQPGNRTDWGTLLTPALGGLTIPATLPPVQEEPHMDLELVMKLEHWTAVAGAVVRREPVGTGEVIATLAGGAAVTIAETKDGVWRLVLLGANADKAGWVVRRGGLNPVTPGGDPALQERWKTAVYTDMPFDDGVADDTDDAAEDAQIAELQQTVNTQTGVIAGLKTRISELELLVGPAKALREALQKFMN